MKISFRSRRRGIRALTFVEALVVATILFVLVALLLPVGYPRSERPVSRVRTEIADIVNAINAYQSAYGRYPVSTNIEASALERKEDLTLGGPLLNSSMPAGTVTPVNSDVVAILMDMQIFPDGTPTVNDSHRLNSKQIRFLNVKLSGDSKGHGMGNDGVYRDSWGNPYIISMDLSGDENCRDVFYRKHSVSGDKGTSGFYGLVNFTDTNGIGDSYAFHGKAMVWSFGPDGKADATKPANVAPNKDNILSWQ